MNLFDQMQQMGEDYLPYQLKPEFEAHPVAKRRLKKFQWSKNALGVDTQYL